MAVLTFRDGPAQGVELRNVERTPHYLRVTRAPTADDGVGWDCLDQLDDEPRPEEEIFVYRIQTLAHVCVRGMEADGIESGWRSVYEHATELHFDEETLRSTERWREAVERVWAGTP